MNRRRFLNLAVTGGIGTALAMGDQANATYAQARSESSTIDTFFENVMPTIRPRLMQYADGLGALLDNIYNAESEIEVPNFVHQRVEEIFSVELANIHEDWNRRIFDSGHVAHYAAYILQDFRNSDVAGTLSNFYSSLGETGRVEFEERLHQEIPDDLVYNAMVRLSWRPFVFDPRETFDYTTRTENPEWTEGNPLYTVTDSNGQTVFKGLYVSPFNFNGNMGHLYDSEGRERIRIDSFENTDPCLYFLSFGDNGRQTDFHSFKTYFGAKGGNDFALYYNNDARTNDSVRFEITGRQAGLLREFFRWER
jgi:hypothetical protein